MSTATEEAAAPTSIDPAAIPAELRRLARWVTWRYLKRGGKPTKVPFRAAAPLKAASSTDPSTWSTFDVALAAYRDPTNKLDGIGFVFAEEGPYAGVDFDNCLGPDGSILPWAKPWLDRLVGYAEVSPSGRGVKLFIRGEVPGGKGRKLPKVGPGGAGAVEVYDRGRFFTVTSNRLDDAHAQVGDGGTALAGLHAEWFPPKPGPSKPARPPKPRPLTMSDREVIDRIERSKQGRKFSALWHGSTDGHKSGSEADLALCAILAWWTGGDVGAIDRLFRQSGLYQAEGRAEKWERITYREPTIDKACTQDGFYDPQYGFRYRTDGMSEMPGDDPAAQGEAPAVEAAGDRPQVLITTEERDVNDQVVRSLAREPNLYARGGELVAIRREKRKDRLVIRKDDAPRIATLSKATIRELMSWTARWVKEQRHPRSRLVTIVPAHPPDWSVKAIADRAEWGDLRRLEGVVEAPCLLADGTILDDPGYDERSGLVYEPSGEFPSIPQAISRTDASRAADDILYVVADFPMAEVDGDDGNAHRCAWLAALLTLTARHAIDGPCPLFLVDGNTPGAGKTKLVDIIAILATGRDAGRTALPEHEEEMRKMVLSIAMEGDPLILLDNVATGGDLGGPSLDLALTGTTVKGRILGETQMSRLVPIYTVWFATGNNLGLKGDMLRRVVPFRIESPLPHPEERPASDFRIKGDLLEYVKANRGRLVVAALTILRGYFQAGRPQADLLPMDYPAWSGLVRQAVHWATGIDPCWTRRKLVAEDAGSLQAKAILAGWAELPNGRTGITTAEALRELESADLNRSYDKIRCIFTEWTRDGKLPSPKMIGKRFKAIEGRVVDGLVMRGQPYQGTNRWAVVEASTRLARGNGGNRGIAQADAGEWSPLFDGQTGSAPFTPEGSGEPTKAINPTAPTGDQDRGQVDGDSEEATWSAKL